LKLGLNLLLSLVGLIQVMLRKVGFHWFIRHVVSNSDL